MAAEDKLVADATLLAARLTEARASIERRFVGQHEVVEQVLAAILSGGHALLVGQPGLGKTMLVDTLSTVLGLDSARIQFTPDLMPADILGSEVLDVRPDGSRAFRFIQGPVFTQLLMADEINRASPRTQSALLQAMQEAEVTIGGEHRPLGRPFHVLATQNPIEQEGTYPLPEAQLDRFLLQIDVDYPDRDTERAILLATTGVEDARARRVVCIAVREHGHKRMHLVRVHGTLVRGQHLHMRVEQLNLGERRMQRRRVVGGRVRVLGIERPHKLDIVLDVQVEPHVERIERHLARRRRRRLRRIGRGRRRRRVQHAGKMQVAQRNGL